MFMILIITICSIPVVVYGAYKFVTIFDPHRQVGPDYIVPTSVPSISDELSRAPQFRRLPSEWNR